MRRVIAALVVVGLAIAVLLLWPRSDPDDPDDTLAAPSSTTSTTTPSSTVTTEPGSTSTTSDGSHVVETVQEAEAILRELWFGWFEGIYNQDEDRIREVVASEHQLRLGTGQLESMEFDRAPMPSDIAYSDTQILRATEDCTVVYTQTTLSGFQQGASTDVHVLRWMDGWRFFSLWAFPDDLWEADCEAQLD